MTRRYGCLCDKISEEETRDVDLTDRRTLKDDDVERYCFFILPDCHLE